MKIAVFVVLVMAMTVTGYVAGKYHERSSDTSDVVLEDYALSNVLSHLAYARYLNKGQTDELRKLLDVDLDGHLNRVRTYQGAVDDAAFEAARIRALNAAYHLWQEHPPFLSAEWKGTEENSFWFKDWEANHAENWKLLRWAWNQCKVRKELKCKMPKK